MADFVLSPALQVIFDRLASPVLQKVADIFDLKENFQKLQDALVVVQAVLEDAEEKQLCSKAVQIWLSNLKDAAYDAEDLLDVFAAAESTQDKVMWLRYSEKLREGLKRLKKLATEGLNFHLKGGRMINKGSDRRETSSFIIEPEIFGRKEDREKIVKMLLACEMPQEENVFFIAIIGLGGLGKTTLAQLAYNDERVMQHFDIRIWVFVSDDFDVKMIMKSVIESATKDKCDFSSMEVLQSKLWDVLHKKKYLIVLDDVWTEDQDEWDKLRPLFRGGVDGSKIIVTTRSRKVAFALELDSPTFPYYLEGLPEDDCWALFKHRAFRPGEDKEYPNLSVIGKEIVKKCGGVPLAAKTVGSLMRFKREANEWLFVRYSEIWNLDVGKTGILPALRLSYFHLPSHLKRCFAFCSVFPRKYEINKVKLIQLWMAEGFIQWEEGGKAPEDIGNEYFNDLLWMSFFQDVEKCDNGGVSGYKMHDIIHDLAQSLAGKESVIFEHGSLPNSCEKIRHSSVVSDFRSFTIPKALLKAERLRTLFLFSGSDLEESICKLFSRFKYLRVLDLNGSGLTSLDESIGCLICLRYLDLSRTLIEELPDAIYKLFYLQTLKLIGCYNLRCLPDSGGMENLRHLNITGCIALRCMLPRETPFWSCQLQTLPMIVVGWGKDLALLGGLKLRGQLHITQLESVKFPAWAELAKMGEKDNLESLGLYWGNKMNIGITLGLHWGNKMKDVKRELSDSSEPSHWSERDAAVGEGVMMGLQPHQNLKMLIVKGYPGIRFPNWTLPNLIMLDLTNCMRCEGLPALGNLSLLKALSLRGMHGLKRIGKEFYGDGTGNPFQSLKELVLCDLPNLECWSSADVNEAFPSLSNLIVNKCPNLTEMPLFRTLQHLELRDCRANVLNSFESLTALSIFAIEKVPELLSLSGGFLANNPLLSSLEIISCPQLSSLPSELENLTALKSLTVRWCEGISSLPKGLQNLRSLESLEISDCHGINAMPDEGIGGLSSLRTLSVENCSNLTSLSTSFQHLTSLEHLTIMYCPSLSSLPKGAQHLFSLRSLTILSFPELTSLPEGLQSIKKLHCLEIRSCSGLIVLPEWFKDLVSLRSLIISDCQNLKKLPEGMKLLTALQHLSIQDCPELEESCRQDWSNIAHIPHKYIGSPEIRQSPAAASSSS